MHVFLVDRAPVDGGPRSLSRSATPCRPCLEERPFLLARRTHAKRPSAHSLLVTTTSSAGARERFGPLSVLSRETHARAEGETEQERKEEQG